MNRTMVETSMAGIRADLLGAEAAVMTALREAGPDAAVASVLRDVMGRIASGRTGMVNLESLLGDDGVAVVPRVPCPSCGKPGMAAATRCGYCWRALTPT